jgi:hypothetical protein
MNPPVNSAEIETFVTDPIVIKTRLGGMVSDIAPAELSMATSSPSSSPRRFMSGNSAGATAAISAAFEPETRYIAPIRTYERPPRKCPIKEARKPIMASASPIASINAPRNTNRGMVSRISPGIPSSMRLTAIVIGMSVTVKIGERR